MYQISARKALNSSYHKDLPMLALFNNFFARSHTGWTKLTTPEGINVLFPQKSNRVCSSADTQLGQMNCTIYSGRWEKSTASTILTVRDYQTATPLEPNDLSASWKDEFQHAMQVSQIKKYLMKECVTEGQHPRCDLLYTNREQTTYTRVSLIANGNRLIVLFTVGMLQEVLAPACSECFQSIRL